MLYRGRDKKEFYLASLLYDSVEYRHLESVKSLLTEKGADPNIILPKKGISPFHLVVGCDSYEFALKVTSLILQNGGNPNVRSDDGLTPVHITAAWGRTEILKLLLSNGGDPEVRDINYKTPFHYAVEEGCVDCLNLLKSYLPVKNDLMNEDESDPCSIVLDKILVNNGFVIGEYDVVDERQNDSIIQKQDHLQSLPHTDTTEYILNWFNKQSNNESSISTGNVDKHFDSISTSFEGSESSLGESDADREAKRFDSKFITFRKVYRKTRSKCSSRNSPKITPPKEDTIYYDTKTDNKRVVDDTAYANAEDLTDLKEYSKESGIVTLPHTLKDTHTFDLDPEDTSQKALTKEEKSSDYLTCSHNSINTFEKNVFEITDDLNNINLESKTDNMNALEPLAHGKTNAVKSERDKSNDSNEMSFVSVSEVYKYEDKQEGVVLYERRLWKAPSEYAKSVKSSIPSTRMSSLPEGFDYDVDSLRKELTNLGFSPGPITVTTKKVYLKKLHQLKKYPTSVKKAEKDTHKKVYSAELERTLQNLDWCNNSELKSLEQVLVNQFENPDPLRKWREGVNKTSFTYLLLDPRITNNLPFRADTLQPLKTWETFLSAIFYVGKGKRTRPYQHLYEAVDLWKKGEYTTSNKKLQTIINIWKSGCGVICLHVFQNVIPVEAYTREAAMISAIKLENLTNLKSGDFYGISVTWPQKQKRMLGVYLLRKALTILITEGERQLCPTDID